MVVQAFQFVYPDCVSSKKLLFKKHQIFVGLGYTFDVFVNGVWQPTLRYNFNKIIFVVSILKDNQFSRQSLNKNVMYVTFNRDNNLAKHIS